MSKSDKPMSVAAALQDGLPRVQAPPGITLRNRYSVFQGRKDRSESRPGRFDSPGKRRREDSLDDAVDKNMAFTSMAGE